MSLIDDQVAYHRAMLRDGNLSWRDDFDGTWATVAVSPSLGPRAVAEKAVLQMYRDAGLRLPQKIVWCASPMELALVRQGLRLSVVPPSPPDDMASEFPAAGGKVLELAPVVASQLPYVGRWRRLIKRRPADLDARELEEFEVSREIWRMAVELCGRRRGRLRRWRLLVWNRRAAFSLRMLLRQKERDAWKRIARMRFEHITPCVFPHRDVCLVSERPVELRRDEQGRFHSLDGPAIRYPDGFSLYAINGVIVDEAMVMRPESITARRIAETGDLETRRILLERFGIARFLLESDAEIISRDRAGILYRKDMGRAEEKILMVRVLNGTPEPDGPLSRGRAIALFGAAAQAAVDAPEGARFKDYMLRVPPTIRTAREAVAWTFGLEAEDYEPGVES